MKVNIEYKLPEEQEDLTVALNGRKYYCALWDIKEIIRSTLKYDEPSEESVKLLERIRNEIPDLDE